jgi:N-carbamoyl-L-amino-acid hydrolase
VTAVDRPELRIDADALLRRLDELARIGARPDGSCCRIALTDEDRNGRDLLVRWMREDGLRVTVDAIGNIFGRRDGRDDGAPIMTGSHIDTVRTGGRYDGALGVLAGLEVVRALDRASIETERPVVVGAFTNEEGARFSPDMLGSLVYAGGLSLDEALAARARDGPTLGEELARIGYAGSVPVGAERPAAYVELHIEQGPVLDLEHVTIGAVEDLQGISWQEVEFVGQSNHAGTTPMRMRHDAGYCAAALGVFLRSLALEMGGSQVATMGEVQLHPNIINVIAARARATVDLRNTDELLLEDSERRLAAFLARLGTDERVEVRTKRLARFAPVRFDTSMVERIERVAGSLGLSCKRMTSGAGHDAQMLARVCPTAMIFVPSVLGISHNPREHTDPEDLVAGANVLLQTLLELAGTRG